MNIQMGLMWLFSVLPAIVISCMYRFLPQSIVIHWNIDGSISYGDKRLLWILAVIPVLLAIYFVVLPKTSSKKSNLAKFNNEYYALAVSVMIFMLGVTVMVILKSFDIEILSFPNIICFCLAILFAITGSIMLKNRNEVFIEIKNRWTKKDDLVWQKTNRLGGKMCILGGLMQAVAAIFTKDIILFYIVFSTVIISALVPNVMSYIWYRKYHK